jgi:hypothetical protein
MAVVCVASSQDVLDRFGTPSGSWQRADRLGPEDRRAFLAARQLTVALAEHLTGRARSAAELRQLCPTCGAADHGRPSLDGLSVSWSHAASAVAAVVGDVAPVAVDLQPLDDRAAVGDVLPAYVLGPDADPLSSWVERETLVKLGAISLDEALTLPERDLAQRVEDRPTCWVDLPTRTCVAVAAIGGVPVGQVSVSALVAGPV